MPDSEGGADVLDPLKMFHLVSSRGGLGLVDTVFPRRHGALAGARMVARKGRPVQGTFHRPKIHETDLPMRKVVHAPAWGALVDLYSGSYAADVPFFHPGCIFGLYMVARSVLLRSCTALLRPRSPGDGHAFGRLRMRAK